MKISVVSGLIAGMLLAACVVSPAFGKGGCAGHTHCAHSHSSAHHSSPYTNMRRLRDSTFTGYAVMKKKGDILTGTFTRFTSSDVRLKTAMNKQGELIAYSRIKLLHLESAGGPLQLIELPEKSGFYRLLVDNDSLALYDQRLSPHTSFADADTISMVFRYKDFTRQLHADFSPTLRKRIVPIINAHYNAGITRKTSRDEVYRIMEARQ